VPKGLKPGERKAWASYIAPCNWLSQDDQMKCQMFCALVVEWEQFRNTMPAARLSVMRALSTDLFESLKRTRTKVAPRKSYAEYYRETH
jgi:hypothetical protein